MYEPHGDAATLAEAGDQPAPSTLQAIRSIRLSARLGEVVLPRPPVKCPTPPCSGGAATCPVSGSCSTTPGRAGMAAAAHARTSPGARPRRRAAARSTRARSARLSKSPVRCPILKASAVDASAMTCSGVCRRKPRHVDGRTRVLRSRQRSRGEQSQSLSCQLLRVLGRAGPGGSRTSGSPPWPVASDGMCKSRATSLRRCVDSWPRLDAGAWSPGDSRGPGRDAQLR